MLLHQDHLRELIEGSAIAPELVEANCESVSGVDLYDLLYPPVPGKNGHGDKRWMNRNKRSAEYQQRFDKCQNSSGWVFHAVDSISGERSGYVRVKLDPGSEVAESWEKNDQGQWVRLERDAKYKSPLGSGVEIPFPIVPSSIWQKCSQVTHSGIEDSPHFWEWLRSGGNIPYCVVEGEKKALSVLSLGFPAIPISGITMWHKKGELDLHPDLKLFATKDREVILIFDNDTNPRTHYDVERQKLKLAYEYIKLGCKVKIVEIPLLDRKKGAIDDFIAAGGNGLKLIGDAIDFEVWQAKKLKQLNRKSDLLLNQRYLDFKLPIDRKIVAVKSPKGTGKTELLARQLKPRIDAGLARILAIGHRVKLLLQTSKRLGIKYIDFATLEDQKKRGTSLCFDSLVSGGKGQIHIEDWRDSIVILDEADQSAIHALMSSTCVRRRPEILENLEAILKICKQVILLSADINDAVIEWIESMIGGEDKAYIVINEYQDSSFNFDAIIYDQTTPDLWFSQLIKSIKKGNKLFIPLSAQREDSKYSSTAIEHKLRTEFPGIKILRMDSVTTSDPLHPASQAIVNSEILKDYQIVLATPVIETGFNIPFEHFDEVWALGHGLISSNSYRQQICRIRPNIPRHLWVANKALNLAKIGSGAISYKQLIEGEHKKDKAIRASLLHSKVIESDADFDCVVSDYHLKAWAKLAVPINAEISCYRQAVIEGLKGEGHRIYSWEDWVKSEVLIAEKSEDTDNIPPSQTKDIAAILPSVDKEIQQLQAIDKQIFASAFVAKLQGIEKEKAATKKTLKANRDEVRINASKKIEKAESIDDSDYEKIKISPEKTEDQVLSLSKKIIEKSFSVEPTFDLIERSWNRRYLPQLKLHYAISMGREFINENQLYKIDNIFNSSNGKRFIPDSNKALSISAKLLYLDFLDIQKLLEIDEIYADHPLAKEIWEKAKNHQNDIKIFLGLTTGKNPIQFFQNLIGLIGFKFPYLKKKSVDGKRIRIYGKPAFDFERNEKGKIKIINDRAVPISDDRDRIFEAWYAKDLARREDKLAAASQVEMEKAATEHLERLQAEMEPPDPLDVEAEENIQFFESYLAEGEPEIVGASFERLELENRFDLIKKIAARAWERSTVLFNNLCKQYLPLSELLMA